MEKRRQGFGANCNGKSSYCMRLKDDCMLEDSKYTGPCPWAGRKEQ